MYPKFIELHLTKDDCLVSLNIGKIVAISDYDNKGEGYLVKTSDRGDWIVRESYEELKQMITDSGCLIRKQDPRLDTEHPLTMEDLKGMVGEPVWNSNTRKWYIIHSVGNTVAMANPSEQSMLVYIKSDLSKYPIYRMKVDGGR